MNFLDQVFLDNTIRNYILVALVILFALLLKRFISKYASALIYKMGSTQWSGMSREQFGDFIITPLERILLVITIILAFGRLNFPEAFEFSIYRVSIRDILGALATAIVIICIVSLILRFINLLAIVVKHSTGAVSDPGDYQLLFFFKDFIKVVFVIFGFIFILKFSFNIDIGNLLTGLSIVGAAMALAARESIENLIASFIIFFDKPFRTGDYVKLKDVTGIVESIGLRSTRIRTNEKSLATVPNKQMVDNILDNWSSRDRARNEIRTLLSSSTSSEGLQSTITGIEELLSQNKMIDSFSVFLQEITNDNALILSIYFTDLELPLDDSNRLRQEINLAIKKLQDELNMKNNGSKSEELVSEQSK